jgi:UV DNA damage endonuclease
MTINLGYACINTTIDCTSNKTFRLKSYSEERLKETIELNLNCLDKIIEWNYKNEIKFFRIGSGLIPFASHEICKFNWQKYYEKEFKKIGKKIKKYKIRVSMHPDQFVVLNSPTKSIVEKSIKEIEYHCDVLDSLGMGTESKITLHVGGMYGNKQEAIERFISNYNKLPKRIKERIVVENDDKMYTIDDCLYINERCGVPVVFDWFHNECNPVESVNYKRIIKTWGKNDGNPIFHYSDQLEGGRKGSHSHTIDIKKYKKFEKQIKKYNVDLMLEVKDKEKSVLKIKDV